MDKAKGLIFPLFDVTSAQELQTRNGTRNLNTVDAEIWVEAL